MSTINNNVIGYVRVSTDGQVGENKFGIAEQEDLIKDYCKEHDLEIVEWVYDKGESGAKERPGFDRIIYDDRVKNPPTAAVVVAKSDRVARDINIYYYYKMCLRKKNMDLISVSEDFGQMGVFSAMFEAFTLCVAQMERENINKRTSGGRRQKAFRGGYAGGTPPYGYKVVEGELVIVPDEAETVRRIFELYDNGKTYDVIRETLREEMRLTRSGGQMFSRSTLFQIVHNRMTYLGYYKYGDMEKWVKGRQEPILSEDYMPENPDIE